MIRLILTLALLLLLAACQSTRNITNIYVYDGIAEITCDSGSNAKPITSDIGRGLTASVPLGLP